MTIAELIDRTVTLLKLVASKSVKQSTEATNLVKELSKLKDWAYPQLTTADMVRVVRCRKCKFYKRYKKKGDPKAVAFYACSLDKKKRDEDFYCGEGKEA